MGDISESSELLKLCWGTLFLCLFLVATALGVGILLPVQANENTTQFQQIEKSFLFSEVWNEEADIQAEEFIAASVDTSVIDKGLELYREPDSRAAVEWFYLHVTGKRDVTYAILNEANRNDVPLSLAFALAYIESRYKTTAVNRNVNMSVDRGLFQLNSLSFPSLGEEDFFDPETSARYGMRHLRFCLDLAGDEVTALAMYNAGATRVKSNKTPRSTLIYVDNIMKYKNKLDAMFADEIISLYPADRSIVSDAKLAYVK
ncbi:MAG: transglycosylase SLT domain-containing protein [Treponema sp.]|nr:transglycosylase SLT domain-containing protein [Treponema sp.]